MKSFHEIIEECGGPDGFLREQQIEMGITVERDKLHELLADAVNNGALDLDRYNEYKRINLRLSIAAGKMARRIRILEGESAQEPTVRRIPPCDSGIR